MSVADWEIKKGYIAHRILFHLHAKRLIHVCGVSNTDQKWFCPSCSERAPDEIQFAADLCKCERFNQSRSIKDLIING